MILLHFFLFIQDTLSQAYSDKWVAHNELAQESTSGLVGLLASHDLAFVVFGVVLIVLTALFVYLFRLDSKLSKLEKKLDINN